MVLRHHGKINCIMICQILHIMAVPYRTIMALACMTHLCLTLIMECKCAAYQKYNFTIALMCM